MEATGKSKMETTETEAQPCATIVHVPSPDGKMHFIGIGALKVVIAKDGPGTWIAQGLDIDYAAAGTSIDEVKKNFENGLVCTIDLHLKAYNSLAKLLKPAPNDVWKDMYYGPLLGKGKAINNYYQISVHLPDQIKKLTVFENIAIQYFELALAA